MQALKKFAKTRYSHTQGFLEDYHNFQLIESLHVIRVEIKKIKAVLGVIHFSNKKFDNHKQFVPLRNIFRKAGAIREPELLLKILMRFEIHGPEPVELSKGPALIAEFKTDIPFFLEVLNKSSKKVLPAADQVSKRVFEKFLSRKVKTIRSMLYPSNSRKEIHTIRKAIKNLLYLSAVNNFLKKRERTFFTYMETAIGNLHDKQVLLAMLKKKKIKADEFLIKSIKSECAKDLKGINLLAEEFYSKK